MKRLVQTVLAAGLLVNMTVWAYVPAMHGDFIWDDDTYLTGDERMESLHGLRLIWTQVMGEDYRHQYYPLTITGFWAQHQLWGEDSYGYHVVNVILHAINAILLWRLLRVLAIPGAWLAAGIFAVHPVHVMSVGWITELKNVLSTLFFLSAALAWVRFLDFGKRISSTDKPDRMKSGWTWYGIGMALFVLALLSKTATAILPIGLLIVLWWKRPRMTGRDWLSLLPMVVIGTGFVLLTVYLERNYTRAQGDEFPGTWVERSLIGGRAIWFYAGKLVWPHPLTFIYPRWEINVGAWWSYTYPLGVVAVVGLLWGLRDRIGKGVVAAVLFFVLAVAPMYCVNIYMTRYSYVSDHWQYWASMGLIVLAASTGSLSASRLGAWPRRMAMLGAAVLLVALGCLTWRQGSIYENREVLWQDTLKKNPDAWIAHNNLAHLLVKQSKFNDAIQHYHHALRLKDDSDKIHFSLASTLLLANNDEDGALRHYREAARLNPTESDAHFNIGALLLQRNDPINAVRYLRQAIELKPEDANSHHTLGIGLRNVDRLNDAVDSFQTAIQLNPDRAATYFNLATAFQRQGKLDDAITQYRMAIRINPEYVRAQNQLGNALLQQNKPNEAINEFRQILETHPDIAGTHFNLGRALLVKGDQARAMEGFREAVRLDPQLAEMVRYVGVELDVATKVETTTEAPLSN